LAQEQSSHVYLSVLLHNMTESKGMVIRDAIVVQVLDAAFDVLVPEYGLEKRVYVDQLPLERHTWKESSETLRLYWGTAAFKAPSEEEEPESNKANQNKRLSALPARVDSMDHPDDATNAYDDERGLFDDDSDYEDEGEHSSRGLGEDSDEDEAEGEDDESRRLTRISIFGHIKVLITADTTVSPPVIKVIAVNPYATTEEDTIAPVGAFAAGIEA